MMAHEQKGATADDTPVIDCRGLWKVFGKRQSDVDSVVAGNLDKDTALERYDAVVAVADASFSVFRGEIFCIMGLSGSGKSTLVRHINRLIEPSAGEIRINGEDVSRLSPKDLRRLRSESIGMVFQNMALFPHRVVRDNIAFGLELRGESPDVRRQAAERMLTLVQLEGWGDRYPSELSGGMQQRVGLARALSADPDILLMDEPFSALDPLIRRQLQDQFLELSSIVRKTTLFITHDLDEAVRLGDRIAIMKDGVLVQIGVPEEIVLNPANDYVEAFVQGISRLKLVSAATIMEPVSTDQEPRVSLDDCPRVKPDCSLKELIDLALDTDRPALVVNESDTPVGIITSRRLLETIQGHC